MTRAELTVKAMKERGFYPTDCNELDLKDIVFNIQENEYWKYLRCTTEKDTIYTTTEFGMCSTYKVFSHKEYLEYSTDKVTWHKVAYRYVEYNRICIYAD